MEVSISHIKKELFSKVKERGHKPRSFCIILSLCCKRMITELRAMMANVSMVSLPLIPLSFAYNKD